MTCRSAPHRDPRPLWYTGAEEQHHSQAVKAGRHVGRNVKAIGLLSGGLDSELALKLIVDQGVEVTAVHFSHVFSTPAGVSLKANIHAVAEELKVELRVETVSREILGILRKPAHGYGSGLNPCIDCRIFQLRRAGRMMEEYGAEFVVTGEVVGQRPMSQHRKTIKLIEKESGLAGLIVRPLSARILEPTVPEERGWIDRGRLLGHSGRSRKIQLELAEKFGFKAFSPPAGGCLLTDPAFCSRVEEALEHGEADLGDIELLKVGRHFRIRETVKAVVGRNQRDNDLLISLSQKGDTILEPVDVPGPTVLLRSRERASRDEFIRAAAELLARYTKKADEITIRVGVTEEAGIRWKEEMRVQRRTAVRAGDPGIQMI